MFFIPLYIPRFLSDIIFLRILGNLITVVLVIVSYLMFLACTNFGGPQSALMPFTSCNFGSPHDHPQIQ